MPIEIHTRRELTASGKVVDRSLVTIQSSSSVDDLNQIPANTTFREKKRCQDSFLMAWVSSHLAHGTPNEPMKPSGSTTH